MRSMMAPAPYPSETSAPLDYDDGRFRRMQRSEMSLPPAYLAALIPLADAFSAYERATGSVAVLAGKTMLSAWP